MFYRMIENDPRRYPMGAAAEQDRVHFSFVYSGDSCAVVLYRPGGKNPVARIPFPESQREGDVWSMTLEGKFQGMEYLYETAEGLQPDPFGRAFAGRERWGVLPRADRPFRGVIVPEGDGFDWEGDRPLRIPYEDCVFYHLHVRGFTRHSSSQVEAGLRGTFRGVQEKIPYLKELGVTTLELQPPAEFDEIMRPAHAKESPFAPQEPDGRINYWGYTSAMSLAPKASYCSGSRKEPVREFKELVKQLHKNGLEIVIELFLSGEEYPAYVLECVRFWVREFHVDGVHLVGYAPQGLLGADPYLRGTKLLADHWDPVRPSKTRYLGEYSDGFMMTMRSFLKGDPGQLDQVTKCARRNPEHMGQINYMANVNGFTLMDLVSYNDKHNEANGENNSDGLIQNLSWNCGLEGPTRKKRVAALRRKQIRNALLLLFLSQGTPLIMAGDEFGATKKGNNNSYCQDNEISWLNWNLANTNSDILQFVRRAIDFRKKHPVLHMKKEPALMDYNSWGLPDVSYHGVKTWCPDFDPSSRRLGILYCGLYGQKEDHTPDNYLYVAYNMHWEAHEFALPNLPRGQQWHLAADTSNEEVNGFMPEGQEPCLENQKQTLVRERSIVVLIGKTVPGQEGDKTTEKRRKRQGGQKTAQNSQS